MHVGMLTNSLFGVGETDFAKVALRSRGLKKLKSALRCLWTKKLFIR